MKASSIDVATEGEERVGLSGIIVNSTARMGVIRKNQSGTKATAVEAIPTVEEEQILPP